ncbi:MAG: NAD(P)/FAD-dependent oxidoreductase [Actinomycetota bacterium]
MPRSILPGVVSLWWDTSADRRRARAALSGDTNADIAIVGAGYTGLWTAYALLRADPSLRVVVCEAEHVGFGASGRNGGWCSALFAGSREQTAAQHGTTAAVAMQRAMFATLDEIERVVRDEAIDCDWTRGGTLQVATLPAHRARLEGEVLYHRGWGFGEDDYRWLGQQEAQLRIGCAPNLGALYTPHCAAIHPAKLVHGLADSVERHGGVIFERTRADAFENGRIETRCGSVRAEVVVRATEAFTPELPRSRRRLVPVYSLMIATEPLPESFWGHAGLAARETFTDGRLLLMYGQRTADDRFAFGGRGAPYHFGSRVRDRYDTDAHVFEALARTLRALFPRLGHAAVTHRWGGAVGIARDWYPSVGIDRASRIAWAGGYVGDGVATANLAGRTLADLILRRDTDLVRLPWVGHRSRHWEPEPLRWLGINGARRLASSIDRAEAAGRDPRRRLALVARLLGG